MPTLIAATGRSTDASVTSSIEHAVRAGKDAIASAGIDVQDVDYLINVGVYRDANMVEPSMAALIQKGIGLNLDYVKYPVDREAFSFDLMNGASGALDGLMVANSLLDAGRAEHVLVVSSDAHPSGETRPDFPFSRLGAAILLRKGKDEGERHRGFAGFTFRTVDEGALGAQSYVDFASVGAHGRSEIRIDADPDYAERLLALATETASAFLEDHDVPRDATCLVSCQPNATFAPRLARALGLPDGGVVDLHARYGDPHTSTFALGFRAWAEALSDAYPQLLFVGASAGIRCGCALYRR